MTPRSVRVDASGNVWVRDMPPLLSWAGPGGYLSDKGVADFAPAVVLTEDDAEELAKLLYVRGVNLATKAAIARQIIRTLIAAREATQ